MVEEQNHRTKRLMHEQIERITKNQIGHIIGKTKLTQFALYDRLLKKGRGITALLLCLSQHCAFLPEIVAASAHCQRRNRVQISKAYRMFMRFPKYNAVRWERSWKWRLQKGRGLEDNWATNHKQLLVLRKTFGRIYSKTSIVSRCINIMCVTLTKVGEAKGYIQLR